MAAVYNLKKREDQILARFAKSPPSFAVHLHPGHWTLNKDNNARTFLYTSPAVSILESIRAHRVPVDMLEMLDQANVSFYDGSAHLGCLIVEEHDHMSAVDPAVSDPSSSENPKPKPQASPSQKRRIVLYPNGETLWADIGLFNVRNGNTWTDQQAIEFEAKILSVTAPPLCLDPDPVASRIATLAMSSTSLESPKRKHSIENDKRDNGTRKAEHDKFMNVMNPRSTRIFHGDFRQITWLEQNRRGERASSPSHRTPSPQASLAPTPTPPPASLPGSVDEMISSQKKKSKKKKGDGPDSPMQVDPPSPGVSSKAKPRKNSVSQGAPPHISKKKQPQQSRRGTASSVEPSPAHPVLQLPPHTTNGQVSSIDSPQSMQASPNPAMGKKDETQSSLGIGVPPSTSHSPAPINQQIPSGPPKKRMKTETPQIGNVPLPGAGSQQGTPQQPYAPLAPHLSAPGQQPNAAQLGMHRYSASPVPTPVTNNQPTQQFHGQPAHNYGHLGLNVANGMMINNGAGISGYNMAGMQQQQAQNMHSNMFTAPGQQQAAAQAGSPHSLPPSRPASQASIPMRNSPRPTAHMPLGGNNPGNLQVLQPDQQGARPASALGQQGMQPNPGMHQAANPMAGMSMDPVQMGFLQMQAQRMAFPGAQGMMQYPGFPMQMPGQPAWRVPPTQMPMGVGRAQTTAQLQQQYAAAMQQRRNAMQAPPNPPR